MTWDPRRDGNRSLSPAEADEAVRLANILYFRSRAYRITWMGVKALKCPMDLWVHQQIMVEQRVDLLIETGTSAGGSALFYAQVFDLMGAGRVVTIDHQDNPDRPTHPRIAYLRGKSLSRDILDRVAEYSAQASKTMIILDSDHKAEHRLLELTAYAPLVSVGSYLISDDAGFDHYPSWPEHGPGPAKAVRAFLHSNPQFQADRSREQHLITLSPGAFLKRIAP